MRVSTIPRNCHMVGGLSKALGPVDRQEAHQMGTHLLHGAPDVPVILRRSGRARRISLRISHLDGRVTLTVPEGVSEREALAFAHQKETWIRGHLTKRGADADCGAGHAGAAGRSNVPDRAGRRTAVVITDGLIAVPGAPDRVGARLAAHLKQIARARLAQACDDYAARLGKSYERISIRDTRSQMGVVFVAWCADVLVAADHGATRGAGLRCRPRGRASGGNEPFLCLLGRCRADLWRLHHPTPMVAHARQ